MTTKITKPRKTTGVVATQSASVTALTMWGVTTLASKYNLPVDPTTAAVAASLVTGAMHWAMRKVTDR